MSGKTWQLLQATSKLPQATIDRNTTQWNSNFHELLNQTISKNARKTKTQKLAEFCDKFVTDIDETWELQEIRTTSWVLQLLDFTRFYSGIVGTIHSNYFKARWWQTQGESFARRKEIYRGIAAHNYPTTSKKSLECGERTRKPPIAISWLENRNQNPLIRPIYFLFLQSQYSITEINISISITFQTNKCFQHLLSPQGLFLLSILNNSKPDQIFFQINLRQAVRSKVILLWKMMNQSTILEVSSWRFVSCWVLPIKIDLILIISHGFKYRRQVRRGVPAD